MAEALRELGGNQAAVARKFAVTRSAVAQYIRRHPSLRAVLEEARSTFVDNVESALYQSALSGNVAAQIFILKTIGRDRGSVERVELGGPASGPLEITFANDWRQHPMPEVSPPPLDWVS